MLIYLPSLLITPQTPKLLYKTFYFFFTGYQNEWKEHEFQRQKYQKSKFYKNRKAFKIYDIDVTKILVSKEESYEKIIQLNISLDIMTMMTLDIYA